MSGIFGVFARRRPVPQRETQRFPAYMPLGQQPAQLKRSVFKPTPRNLRAFGKHPLARRAINAIKNPLMELKWEVKPIAGVDLNSELKRQIDAASAVIAKPNDEDDYHSFFQQVIEDLMFGAGAIETQLCGDPSRPVFMWPVDGLSIQLFPHWEPGSSGPRFQQTMGYGGFAQIATPVILRDDELIYIKPNPSTATPFGLGPMEVAFDTIARKLGAEKYAGQVASNAGPPYLLDLGAQSEEYLLAFRKFWRDQVEGRGEIPIWADASQGLTDGRDKSINTIELKPSDDKALYLAWQELLAREIGSSFDLSPQNFGIEHDVNRSTSEVAEDRDWDQAIKPWARFYTRTITSNVIQHPKRMGFAQLQFVLEGLDREDELSTSQIHQIRFNTNSITGNEIREAFGEARLDNATADMTCADIEIAKAAAHSVSEQLDPDLTDFGTAGKSKPPAMSAPGYDQPPQPPLVPAKRKPIAGTRYGFKHAIAHDTPFASHRSLSLTGSALPPLRFARGGRKQTPVGAENKLPWGQKNKLPQGQKTKPRRARKRCMRSFRAPAKRMWKGLSRSQ